MTNRADDRGGANKEIESNSSEHPLHRGISLGAEIDARFEVRRRLGEGGMGVVYHAYDRARRSDVALKTLHRIDASGVARLKREFRALADVAHSNLVVLHELISARDAWFFTMELVWGIDFMSHVRGSVLPASPLRSALTSFGSFRRSGARSSTLTAVADPGESFELSPAQHRASLASSIELSPALGRPPRESVPLSALHPTFDVHVEPPEERAEPLSLEAHRRLCDALGQLALGVLALHDAGKLHLDLKPSNILVTPDGRVVILDFGLVGDLSSSGSSGDIRGLLSANAPIAGTPAYMAPEQARGDALTQAADWYAVGGILFEALTGRLPFWGAPLVVLTNKQYARAPHPAEFAPGIPTDLGDLCAALLQRDPKKRPDGREILRILGHPSVSRPAPPARLGSSALFVGRELELAELHAAFASVSAEGRPSAVFLHGSSGIGKSSIVRRFRDELRRQSAAVILSGRCYERESVPFKAWDSVVDALTAHIARLPESDAARLLSPAAHDLARLFPAFRAVAGRCGAPPRAQPIADLYELRASAFRALKEILVRLAREAPLVLYIDDLHWGDRDSALLLAEILSPPDPPPLLLVGTYRSEEERTSPFLLELFGDGAVSPSGLRTIALRPLSSLDVGVLAYSLLGAPDDATLSRALAVAREAEGNPFFVTELARHIMAERASAAEPLQAPSPPADSSPPASSGGYGGFARLVRANPPSFLERLLLARLDRLPQAARCLLEVIAVAGVPIEQGVAFQAVELAGDPRAALAFLRADHLVRTRGADDTSAVETYHDRIREAVVAHLEAPRLVACHLGLALSLEATGRAEPEALAVHFAKAGDPDRAARYALQAADQAFASLAFDRAARLYRKALSVTTRDPASARALRRKLGDALQSSGRFAEAARVYLEASEGAPRREALDLRRRAAEKLLMSGYTDQGIRVLRDVLAQVGLSFPESTPGTLLSLLAYRSRLALRGRRFIERDEASIDPETLLRVDVAFSAVVGLMNDDPFAAAALQARFAAMALDAGEPNRIVLGSAWEVLYLSFRDAPSALRAAEVEVLARRLGNAHAEAFLLLSRSVKAINDGAFRAAVRYCDQAEALLRERCVGVAWSIGSARSGARVCLAAMGEIADLSRRIPIWLRDADELSDRYSASTSRVSVAAALVRLAADDPEGARRDIDAALRRVSMRKFHPARAAAEMAYLHIEVYSGDTEAAYRRVVHLWGLSRRALFFRVPVLRGTLRLCRGISVLVAATVARDPEPLLRLVERDANAFDRDALLYGPAASLLFRACAASIRGDKAEACRLARRAIPRFELQSMKLHSAFLRRAVGVIVGGSEGRALIDAADAVIAAEGIKRPDRMAMLYVPGFALG